MPLVTITTKHALHPVDSILERDRAKKETRPMRATADFARALPRLFVSNKEALDLDPDTPEKGVQVTHRQFHAQDVNTPDMWVLIFFNEEGLTKDEQKEVTAKIDEIISIWFDENNQAAPYDLAVDCLWGTNHGFLYMGTEVIRW